MNIDSHIMWCGPTHYVAMAGIGKDQFHSFVLTNKQTTLLEGHCQHDLNSFFPLHWQIFLLSAGHKSVAKAHLLRSGDARLLSVLCSIQKY